MRIELAPTRWRHLTPVGIDFETYYDDKYTLKKMTPEEYIRDDKFEITGLSIRMGGKSQWFTAATIAEYREFLQRIPWGRVLYYNHNAAGFDGLVLHEILGCTPAVIYCSLSGANALASGGEDLDLGSLAKKYGIPCKLDTLEEMKGVHQADMVANPDLHRRFAGYAVRDIDIAAEVTNIQMQELPEEEIELIDLFSKFFCIPRIEIDVPLAAALRDQVMTRTNQKIALTGLTRKQLGSTAGPDAKNSNPVAEEFRRFGIEPDIKPGTGKDPSKRTYAFAKTDPFMESMLNNDDERVSRLAEARLATKSNIEYSRLDRLVGIGQRGLLPAPITYGRAITHRAGGAGKINLQNMNRVKAISEAQRGDVIAIDDQYLCMLGKHVTDDTIELVAAPASEAAAVNDGTVHARHWKHYSVQKDKAQVMPAGLRSVIRAPEGKTFSVSDSSQIEMRAAHTYSGQMDTVETLVANLKADLYSDFASTLYGREISKKNPKERMHGKIGMLQLQYQAGKFSFQNAARVMGQLKLPLHECDKTVRVFRQRFKALRRMWARCLRALEAMYAGEEMTIDEWGLVTTSKNTLHLPGGLTMIYAGLHPEQVPYTDEYGVPRIRTEWRYRDKKTGAWKKIYGGMLFENIIQALSRSVVFLQMLDVHREFNRFWGPGEGVVLTVHDEIVALSNRSLAPSVTSYMIAKMQEPPRFWPQLPVYAEGGEADVYALAK